MKQNAENTYHYGQTIRRYRVKRGMTQCELAGVWPSKEMGVSVRYLADIESGKKHISDMNTLRAVATILDIPLWQLGLSDYDPWQPGRAILQYQKDTYHALSYGGSTMDQLRRTLVNLLAGSTVLTPVMHEKLFNPDMWESLAHVLKYPSHTDKQSLEHCDNFTNTLWDLYSSNLPRADLLKIVESHLSSVYALLRNSQPLSIQRELCYIVSSTSRMLGGIYMDLDNEEKSLSYHTLASHASHEAGNDYLNALALTHTATVHIAATQYKQALPLLQQASRLAVQCSVTDRAWINMVHAELLSKLSRTQECIRTMDTAKNVFSSSSGSGTVGQPVTIGGIHSYELFSYINLQQYGLAEIAAHNALNGHISNMRTPAVLIGLSTVYMQQHNIDAACEYAAQALEYVVAAKSPRSLKRILILRNSLQTYNDTAGVKRLNALFKPVVQVYANT